ncbi:hypothetical protein ACFW0H_16525 [Pseudomonas sp. CR3202]|uniref:hypothetical protein n=1 Tax=Pseudomonas sp. CR3202 TaxID=3351532 RepID=UPI003BEFC731
MGQAICERLAEAIQLTLGDEATVNAALQELAANQRIHTLVIASGSDISQPRIGELNLAQQKRVIDAGIFHRLWADGTFDEKWKDAVQAKLCIKHWGMAEAAAFLASNRAGYTTGQILAVDGSYGV